ncbi:conserved phage C-terminal domain-containing protein [Lactobacillus paragasseri]|uniref:conserved phage C-terminal domain-containing protein n=1 Tax=Lactobacillus paragasseri TaxID=2107999 RepID=UPI0016483EB5|nr:conserved phage C-terminal domain-containing protein [Lactobacillus paragasseri]MBO3729646.1 conserved phage C-terminal domain-containing protein [Lactobacillus paragasseri]MED7632427.1 DNA replication protein [Lactobacillus paragasseri]
MGRRMISSKVVDTDNFLDMPSTSQNLYFHLLMHADDDGFLGNPKTITRSIGAHQDDLTLLVEKGYLFVFEDGAIAIKDWFIHNYIPKDRYHETVYKEDKKKLEVTETQQYRLVTRSPIVQDTDSKQDDSDMDTKSEHDVNSLDTSCIQDDNNVYTEDKLSKDNNNKLSSSENVDPEPKQKSQKIPYEKIIDYLNRKTDSHYRPTSKATRRLIKARYNEGFTDIDFKTVIDKKCAEWLQDGNMVQYLRPETLFGTKFEAYLNQPDTGPIPRRNFGNKPVRRSTNWDKIQQQQSQTVPQMTQEERNAIFREYGR